MAEHALRVALEGVDEAKVRLRCLCDQRAVKAGECEQARVSLPTIDELIPLVREKIQHMEATLTRDVAQRRLGLGALLEGEWLRVYADGRIEGSAILPRNELAAPGREPSERQVSIASGGPQRPGLARLCRTDPG